MAEPRIDIEANHTRDRSCPVATRIGVGRATTFGLLSAGIPALAHGASGLMMTATVVVLAMAFSAWSWRTRCTPRTAAALAWALATGQLVVHGLLTLAARGGAAPDAVHAQGRVDDANSAAGAALMLTIHLLAIVYGVIALRSLERRALSYVATCVRRLGALLGLVPGRAPAAGPHRPRPEVLLRADDAAARRIRRLARSLTRRGPPSPWSLRHVAA